MLVTWRNPDTRTEDCQDIACWDVNHWAGVSPKYYSDASV
jgi:hypothetical protein